MEALPKMIWAGGKGRRGSVSRAGQLGSHHGQGEAEFYLGLGRMVSKDVLGGDGVGQNTEQALQREETAGKGTM